MVIITIIALVFTGCSEEKKIAIANYDSECTRINSEYEVLQKTINDSQALIDAGEKPYDESTVNAGLRENYMKNR